MLAQLKGLFTPDAIASALKPMPELESTVMDALFKNRPTHPLPVIGVQELINVVQTAPVVRRDGAPVALEGESAAIQYIAPLPVKVKVPVTASELNDLRAVLLDLRAGSHAAVIDALAAAGGNDGGEGAAAVVHKLAAPGVHRGLFRIAAGILDAAFREHGLGHARHVLPAVA